MPPEFPPALGEVIPPPPDRTNRTYNPATWAAPGMGGGHPKLAGGEETSNSSGRPVGRGFNRPDQRYTKPAATLQADRYSRASAEYAGSLVLRLRTDTLQVITQNGNAYEVPTSLETCSCPDFFRLEASYPSNGLLCKHIIMAGQAITDFGIDGIPYSIGYCALVTPLSERTIMNQAAQGFLTASIVINAWRIWPTDFDAWWNAYKTKITPPLP